MEEIKSNAPVDFTQEPVILEFLKKNVFPKYFPGQTPVFANEKRDQYAGIDFFIGGHKYDVKAQTNNYINNPTPTFCLEAACYNPNGEWVKGWLTKKVDTEYWIFVWIYDAKVEKRGKNNFVVKPEDIYTAEIMVVDAVALKNKIIIPKMSLDEIWEFSKTIIKHETEKHPNLFEVESPISIPQNGLKFTLTTQKVEHPVNIILFKDVYKRFATIHCLYSRGKMADLPAPIPVKHCKLCEDYNKAADRHLRTCMVPKINFKNEIFLSCPNYFTSRKCDCTKNVPELNVRT